MPRRKKVAQPDVETVPLDSLRSHPRNYRGHPADQIEHLKESLRRHGLYRNLVVARDGTILAGHGIAEAARQLGMVEVKVIRQPYGPDDPRALQILAGDNYLSHFAEDNDRELTDLLRELASVDALFGTGFDTQQLAALAMITRPLEEIRSFDAAQEWLGMPEFSPSDLRPRLILTFEDEEGRVEFVRQLGLNPGKRFSRGRNVWSVKWPDSDREDTRSLVFDDGEH
jgi:hypothetical protein